MQQKFWEDRPVLITGCSGFVGSWLALRLIRAGARVVALVRDWDPDSNFVRGGVAERVCVVNGSVTDSAPVARALNEHSIDTCFHLAAQALVGVANRSPLSTFEANIKGTWNVLEATRLCPTVQRVIVASSDKAYGDYPESRLPYTEEYALQGRYPYDVSKSCVDLLAQSYWHTFFAETGRPFLGIARCANLYGGGDSNRSRLIPDTILALLEDRDPVIRGHGKHVREFLYVLDGVEGYLVQAERCHEAEVAGEAFNFGGDGPMTVQEVVEHLLTLAAAPGRRPVISRSDPTPGEILAQYLDSSKASRRLNWRAKYPLDAGLLDALEWYRAWQDAGIDPARSLWGVNLRLLERYDEATISQT